MPNRQEPDGTRADPLQDRAALLLPTAQALAITLLVPMSKEHPYLAAVTSDDWDFFLTTAFVFVALTQLNHEGVPEARRDAIQDIVSQQMNDWAADAYGAFEDCKTYYDRTWDALVDSPHYAADRRHMLSAHIIGSWLCWNLLRHAPASEQERDLATQLGTIAAHEFTAYWRSDAV